MSAPLAFGRRLPLADTERDDATLGAGGKWVTCVDTSVMRDAAWATNGRIVRDGKALRALIHDSDGISLAQAKIALHKLTALDLITPQGWDWTRVDSWLLAGRGLVAIGRYDALPLADRYQVSADFAHAIFFTHRSLASGIRTYDALNPSVKGYGRWLPVSHVRAFIESGGFTLAYIPLQSL